jgi:translation initiation factor IF-1
MSFLIKTKLKKLLVGTHLLVELESKTTQNGRISQK